MTDIITTDAATIRVDPRDYRLDGRLARRIWRLVKPYWSNVAHWKSWVLMMFTVMIGPAWSYYNFKVAQITADQANALVAKDEIQWKWLFWLIFFLSLGRWLYGIILGVLTMLMKMQWYRWMTDWIVERYLGSRTYYDISMKADIDNPDERIQTNVEPFITAMVDFPTMLITTILAIATNGLLVMQVSSSMTAFVLLYSTISLVVQTVMYWPLIRKNFDMVAANADFRFGLLRVRDNAETIAFFRGEEMEKKQVKRRIHSVVRRKMGVYYYQTLISFISQGFDEVWTIAPLFFIYPLYFTGQIKFGIIALATSAAMQMRESVLQIQQYVPYLTSVAPSVVRMSHIIERAEQLERQSAQTDLQIQIERDQRIELRGVCFETPGGEQKLAQNVSLSVAPGESLIIIGQTGVGKSSILRSMAGLWTRGSGTMVMPPVDDVMFVPQKPYMMLGDLRAQLLYPHGSTDMTEAEIRLVLERVCLPDLIEKAGGLDAQRDWSRIFSLGEQQRISFARILISRPRFVFLDEATSAVDIPTEARLYQALIESGTTFVSVGHRETILRFHDRALRLAVGGGWEILSSGEIEVHVAEPLGAVAKARARAVEQIALHLPASVEG